MSVSISLGVKFHFFSATNLNSLQFAKYHIFLQQFVDFPVEVVVVLDPTDVDVLMGLSDHNVKAQYKVHWI